MHLRRMKNEEAGTAVMKASLLAQTACVLRYALPPLVVALLPEAARKRQKQ